MNQTVEYSVTDAKIAELKEVYSVVPDASTKAGYADVKAALKVLVPLRTGVEKKRKELKKDALAWGKLVDSEAKRITSALIEIETPFKDAKFQVDNAKKIAEQKRVDDINHRIECYGNIAASMIGQDSESIQQAISDLKDDPCNGFAEFTKEALEARNAAIDTLAGVLEMQRALEEKQAQPEPEPEPEPKPEMSSSICEILNAGHKPATREDAVKALMQCGMDSIIAYSVVDAVEAGRVPGLTAAFGMEF